MKSSIKEYTRRYEEEHNEQRKNGIRKNSLNLRFIKSNQITFLYCHITNKIDIVTNMAFKPESTIIYTISYNK